MKTIIKIIFLPFILFALIIKCKLGFHDWTYDNWTNTWTCLECGKTKRG